MNNSIGPFVGPFAFLDNYYQREFDYTVTKDLEVKCLTVEHGLAFAKFEDPEDGFPALNMLHPKHAHEYAEKYKLLWRPDWKEIEETILVRLLLEKFKQNQDLRDRLLETKPDLLMNYNKRHDNTWGICVCPRCYNTEGENKLGEILMAVRTTLYEEKLKLMGEMFQMSIKIAKYMPEWKAIGLFQ